MALPSYSSNIPDLADRDGADLGSSSPDQDPDLGGAIARAVAARIRERTVDRGLDATGEPLKENEPGYAERKRRKHGSSRPLVLTGQMLSIESLEGSVEVGPDSVTITYGTGTGDGDGPSDRRKADWNSDERPFFALDDEIIDDAIMPLVLEAFDREFKGQG